MQPDAQINSSSTNKNYTCEFCGQRAQMQTKWILQLPNAYTIGLQWIDNVEYGQNGETIPSESSKVDIQRILNLIPPNLDLSDFYQTSNSSQDLSNQKKQKGKKKPQYHLDVYGNKHFINDSKTDSHFVNSNYILRGMIVFYGRHYMAYFYSEKHDAWYLYDDA